MKKAHRQEAIAEARAYEVIAGIAAIIGVVMVAVGFVLDNITRTGWIGFLPYEYHPYHDVATGLWTSDVIIGFIGAVIATWHHERRKKLLKESEEDKD
jgi:hypothetical protein